jgi:hypothetical protein
MTYAKLCIHGCLEAHLVDDEKDWAIEATHCPGGSVLADDTLTLAIFNAVDRSDVRDPQAVTASVMKALDALAAAQGSQE